jgi:hypothetical protein
MGNIKIRITKNIQKEQTCYLCNNIIKPLWPAYYTAGKDKVLGFYSKYSHIECFIQFVRKNNVNLPPELLPEGVILEKSSNVQTENI